MAGVVGPMGMILSWVNSWSMLLPQKKFEQMKYIGRIIRSDFRRIDGTVFLSDAERPGVPI